MTGPKPAPFAKNELHYTHFLIDMFALQGHLLQKLQKELQREKQKVENWSILCCSK